MTSLFCLDFFFEETDIITNCDNNRIQYKSRFLGGFTCISITETLDTTRNGNDNIRHFHQKKQNH